ncbi:adenylate kinase isoenzyme 5-like [Protopterus annectens]|uniref:adenylate kinase isoenzyme 5-like n=1 Tax=Protopterus annectens TaxID=7888 RepID=UPI001CFAA5C7|nr:adenylate kinase isoenzyme 5-like [Protopterus annectens]
MGCAQEEEAVDFIITAVEFTAGTGCAQEEESVDFIVTAVEFTAGMGCAEEEEDVDFIITAGSFPQICTPDLVIFLACANHRLKERLEKRAEQQGRPDDNPRATERRLTNFKQNAVPLVKFYQEKGLIVTFDADRDEEDVFYDISVTVDSKLFPGREPVAGPSELDLSLIADPCDAADAGSDYDDQALSRFLQLKGPEADDQSTLSGDETVEEDFRKTKIIFVIGGPGSGKGTLCQQLVQRYGLTHLNTGDLLESTKSSSAIEGAHLIKDTKECGKLVSMDILLDLIKEAMIANMGSTKGFLIDGYPQELWQGEEFENKIAEPSLVLFLECSSETMIKRLLKQNTGDNTDAHSKRVETFCQEAKPVIEYYSKKTHLCKINAEECPENVFTQTCDVIGPIF